MIVRASRFPETLYPISRRDRRPVLWGRSGNEVRSYVTAAVPVVTLSASETKASHEDGYCPEALAGVS